MSNSGARSVRAADTGMGATNRQVVTSRRPTRSARCLFVPRLRIDKSSAQSVALDCMNRVQEATSTTHMAWDLKETKKSDGKTRHLEPHRTRTRSERRMRAVFVPVATARRACVLERARITVNTKAQVANAQTRRIQRARANYEAELISLHIAVHSGKNTDSRK